MESFLKGLKRLPARLAEGAIKAYQVLLSPFFGGSCRFNPTCSEYAITAIRRFGLLKGGLLTAKRILKCNPLFPGGNDPVPERWPHNVKE